MQIYYNMCLGQVHLNALVVYHESKKLSRFDSNDTFSRIQLYPIFSKDIEAALQVPNVFTHMLALHQHVVYIDFQINGTNILFINLWYMTLAFFKPKGITR